MGNPCIYIFRDNHYSVQQWQQSLELSGFVVKLLNTDHQETGAIITWQEMTVNAVLRQGKVFQCLLGTQDNNFSLYDAIERVIIASGARITGTIFNLSFKHIFLCPVKTVGNLIDKLETSEFVLDSHRVPFYKRRSWAKNLPPDFMGVLEKRGVSVALFAGESMDFSTGDILEYIAIDHHNNFLPSNKHTQQIVEEVVSALIQSEARPLKVGD